MSHLTLRDQITEIINEYQIIDFHFCRLTQYRSILNRIANRFLKRGVFDLNAIWLWEHFKKTKHSLTPDDSLNYLTKQLPDENFYFIASDENGKYWVATGSKDAILMLLGEMFCFEYYIIDQKMSWIIAENHHGVLIQSGVDILNIEKFSKDSPG